MSNPVLLQSEFEGMWRDAARDRLPEGKVWNSIDYIPTLVGAPLRQRGPWQYASPALTGGSSVLGLCRTPAYGAGEFNVAVTSDGGVDRFTDAAKTNIGTAFTVAQNPVVHRSGTNWLVVILAASGSTTPKSWDGTTFGNLAGTPPQAIYGDVYLDRLAVANGTVGGTRYPGRVWLGPAGNAAGGWDTTYAFVDTSEPVLGLASLHSGLMVFHRNYLERITGTSVPSSLTTGGLKLDRQAEIGVIDAQSITKYHDQVIWADVKGVYKTDGIAEPVNLTAYAGMSEYWQDVILSLDSNYTMAGGVVRDTYILSVMNGTTPVDCLCYDLRREFWFRFSNIPARCFARVPGQTAEKVYMGMATAKRVMSAYVLFHPDSGVATDDDGTAILPSVELPYYRPGFGLQQWKDIYISRDVRASGSPVTTVSYVTDPSSTSYTSLAPTLSKTTRYKRQRIPIGKRNSGLGFKIAQSSAGSTDNRLYAIEADFAELEPGGLEQ